MERMVPDSFHDRWNGRHQFTRWFGDGGMAIAMHELFSDTSFGYTQTDAGRFSLAVRLVY